MEALRQYVISVVAAALLCGIFRNILGDGATGRILKLVCGLFLAYAVLQPLGRLDVTGEIRDFLPDIDQAEQAVAAGEAFSQDAMTRLIKTETAAYILDKATALGLEVTVEVTLDEENRPAAVSITGEASPQERRKLASILALDLGIPKEAQQWSH